MKMPKLLRVLFTRSDPAMDAAVEQTKANVAGTVAASNRLHAVIGELLDRNDTLTLRRTPNAQGNRN